MSRTDSAAATEPRAFFIEVADRQVGLALRQPRGFSFVAADPAFQVLDGSQFQRLEQLQEAARRLAANLESRGPRARFA